MAVVGKKTVFIAGHRAPIVGGKVYEDDDAIVRERPWLFESAEDYAHRKRRPLSTVDLGGRSMTARRVEQATAAPGEKRDVDLSCKEDDCDFVARSPAGLTKHRRTHERDE